MPIVHELAYAKLNLYLHVTGKRPDGYHTLDSLVAFADAHDVIEAQPADSFSLEVSGPFASQIAANDHNLVLRAAKLLAQQVDISRGAKLTLHKNLPVGAGLGGGSADAAATLRALTSLWQLNMQVEDLQTLGTILGADVAVCINSAPSLMSGIGDIVKSAPPLPRLYLLLANPGTALLTADVFKNYKSDFSAPHAVPASFNSIGGYIHFLQAARNDLEPAAIQLMPEIALLKQAIAAQHGCLLSRMSGSGATCFGLFLTLKDAQKAALEIAEKHPKYWVWTGTFQ